MMRFLLFIFVLLSFSPMQVLAKGQLLSVDLAEDHVDITTGFDGVELKLFGVQDEPGDIAITLMGPNKETVVRQKENAVGVWMNRDSMNFEGVPVYYNFAVSRDVEKVATPDIRKENRIGLNAMRYAPENKDDFKQPQIKEFQDGLVRNKQQQGLYPLKGQPIKFIDDHFFRTSFYIPANASVGDYTLKTYLLQDGKVRDVKTTTVRVAQVGLSASIFNFAQKWSFAYGFMCVCFALMSGWLSSVIRQRLR